jgi:hypothetical protein
VDLGSSLRIENGAVLAMKRGTIDLLNDGWMMNIYANSTVNVNPGGGLAFNVDANFPIVNGVQINIETDAWLKVISGTWLNATPLKNEGGSLILESNTTASFGGRVDNDSNGPSIKQTSGATYLAADASLGNTRGMLMSGGAIVQKSGNKPQGFAGNILSGEPLEILGGDILFQNMSTGDDYAFGEFLVHGNVIWKGGTFKPFVCSNDTNLFDQWRVTGGVFAINTPNGTAAIQPTAVNAFGELSTPAVGMTWEILKADNGFLNNNKPTFDNNTWALDAVGTNPVTIWKLRKT